MRKISAITLHFEDGAEYRMERGPSKWLFLGFNDDDFRRHISLSGDIHDAAAMLKMLDVGVTQTMFDTHGFLRRGIADGGTEVGRE